jgi:hypothetical protein
VHLLELLLRAVAGHPHGVVKPLVAGRHAAVDVQESAEVNVAGNPPATSVKPGRTPDCRKWFTARASRSRLPRSVGAGVPGKWRFCAEYEVGWRHRKKGIPI